MRLLTAIDLSSLPSPEVVEPLEYEVIKAAMVADLKARYEAEGLEFTALLESDPAVKVIEVAAFREMILRQRVNDAARSVMLAFATDGDLDHLAAPFGITRLLLDPGDPDAKPPVPPTWETDDRLRRRVTMAFDGYPTAGSVESYEFHAFSATAQVRDVDVSSPAPGEVVVTVLSIDGDGTPDQTTLDAVAAAVTADKVRPLTDHVTVAAPGIAHYTIEATLSLYSGPDQDVVRQAALAAVTEHANQHHRLGSDVTLSGLYGALHRPGVHKVTLTSPAADIDVPNSGAAWCAGITINVANERNE